MKKLLFSLLAVLLVFCGCSKDDNEEGNYTEKQQKAFALFNGTWADVQFSNLGTYPGAELQPEPDKIVWGTHYNTEREIKTSSYMEGEKTGFYAQGECSYFRVAYKGEPYEDTKCYYYVTPSANTLSLWSVSENKMLHTYELSIKSEKQFYLYQSGITLPYIFEKQ